MDTGRSPRDQGERNRGEAERPPVDPVRADETQHGSGSGSVEIERDIARTRANMDETVSEIQRRLQPDHLRREARDAVRDTFSSTAQGAKNRMFDTIKENPLPSVLAGISLGWLIAKGATSDDDDRRYDRYDRRRRVRRRSQYGGSAYDEYEQDAYRYDDADYEPRGARYEASAQRRAEREYREYDEGDGRESRSAGERASDAASQAQDQAQQYGRQAQRQAEQYGRRAQRQAQRAENTLEHWMEDNPLAVGAATLALGAFAGLVVPTTDVEDEFMGDARDRVVHQAQDAAKETAQRAQRVAEKTAEDAKETAKEEAEKEKEKSDRV